MIIGIGNLCFYREGDLNHSDLGNAAWKIRRQDFIPLTVKISENGDIKIIVYDPSAPGISWDIGQKRFGAAAIRRPGNPLIGNVVGKGDHFIPEIPHDTAVIDIHLYNDCVRGGRLNSFICLIRGKTRAVCGIYPDIGNKVGIK